MARSGEFIFLGGDRKPFQADDTRRNDVSDFWRYLTEEFRKQNANETDRSVSHKGVWRLSSFALGLQMCSILFDKFLNVSGVH